MRTLYDTFLHGFGRHVKSEDWVFLALAPLDHYLHHHSRTIVAYFDLSLLGWVVCRYHTLPRFLSWLFSLLSSTLFHHSSYPFSFSFTLVDRCFASWTMCPLVFITYHLKLFICILAKSLGSHDSLIFDIAHSKAWYYLLGIWALFPIVSFTFYHWPSLRSES